MSVSYLHNYLQLIKCYIWIEDGIVIDPLGLKIGPIGGIFIDQFLIVAKMYNFSQTHVMATKQRSKY